MRIRTINRGWVDATTLTDNELHTELLALEDSVNELERSIHDAQVDAATTGMYADAQWYADVNFALRKRRQTVQRIRQMLGQRRREKDRPLAEYFVDVCRAKLPARVFERMLAMAQERKAAHANHP